MTQSHPTSIVTEYLKEKYYYFLIVEGFRLLWKRIPTGFARLKQTACNPNLGVVLGVAEIGKGMLKQGKNAQLSASTVTCL